MKIVSAKNIKEIDAKTIEEQGIMSFDLMKRAADALTREIIKFDTGGCFHIFAGAGNNGGDAILTGINLHNTGRKVKIYHFNTANNLSEDCNRAKSEALATEGLEYTEIIKSFDKPQIDDNDIIIDGLFGTGIKKPLDGGYAAVAALINKSDATTFAIDIPSGLMPEDNSFNNMHAIVKADRTFTLQTPKLALLFQEFGIYTGEVHIVNIGLSEKAIAECDSPYETIERDMAAKIIRKRSRHTHKGNYGKALLIAGSYGMSGAATLAAKGCLRSGVGILKLQVPSSCVNVLQTTVPEAIICPDFHEHIFTSLNCDTSELDVIGIGPGLRQDPLTIEGFKDVLTSSHFPLVIDADGLNIIAEEKQLMRRIPQESILTPHIGEFDRIIGRSKDPYERLSKAIGLAEEFNLYIILKSSYTAVITPQGKTYFNTIGNPGMATGGSGDVLTGVVTALLAQGYSSLEASILGTYVHSLAGDIAADIKGETGMTSGDIAECLPQAWKSLAMQ